MKHPLDSQTVDWVDTTKNQQLDLWLKAKRGRLVKLAAQMGVTKQYLSGLRRLKSGISDKRWGEILEAMKKVGE